VALEEERESHDLQRRGGEGEEGKGKSVKEKEKK
jgi:hypothetical protein